MADFPPMTDKAAEAFEDYADMLPSERSLEALAAEYQSRTEPVPTRQLSRLKIWSSKYQWRSLIDTVATERAKKKLAQSHDIDADTFLRSSKKLNDAIRGAVDPREIVTIRESVRKPTSKATATVDVTHSGTIKHAHHDMSQFTDEEIDTLAEIARRQKVAQ